MMFFDGYIGAPPTVTVFSDICASTGTGATAAATAKMAALAKRAKPLDMTVSNWVACWGLRGGVAPAAGGGLRRRREIRGLFAKVSGQVSRMREHSAFPPAHGGL